MKRNNSKKKTKKDLQEWLKRFQAVSQQSAKKERQFQSVKSSKKDAPIPQGPMSESFFEEPQQQVRSVWEEEEDRKLQVVQSELDFHENLILNREAEITQIEQSMAELNEIFRDLNSVVVDQQTLVDNIETNIEKAHADVDNGVDELHEAKEIQKNSKTRICLYVCIAVLIICLCVSGGVLAWKFS